MDVSVIVPTLNRCGKLTGLLQSLERLSVPDGVRLEVVIVDNGSTDGTGPVCEDFVRRHPGMSSCLRESGKGKSRALNRGIREAGGDILAFTDDDCRVDERWLQELVRAYRSDPDLALAGGRVELLDRSDLPLALQEAATEVLVDSAGMLYPDPPVIGCNMAVRKDVLKSVGSFDENMGPGTRAMSAEDLDLVYRTFRAGYKVMSFPSFVVYHGHGRKSDEERSLLVHQYHIGRGAFYAKHFRRDPEVRRMAVRDVLATSKRALIGRGRRGAARFLGALVKGALTRAKARG